MVITEVTAWLIRPYILTYVFHSTNTLVTYVGHNNTTVTSMAEIRYCHKTKQTHGKFITAIFS